MRLQLHVFSIHCFTRLRQLLNSSSAPIFFGIVCFLASSCIQYYRLTVSIRGARFHAQQRSGRQVCFHCCLHNNPRRSLRTSSETTQQCCHS